MQLYHNLTNLKKSFVILNFLFILHASLSSPCVPYFLIVSVAWKKECWEWVWDLQVSGPEPETSVGVDPDWGHLWGQFWTCDLDQSRTGAVGSTGAGEGGPEREGLDQGL